MCVHFCNLNGAMQKVKIFYFCGAQVEKNAIVSDLDKLQFEEQKCATTVLRNACFLARASRCWKRKLNGARA